MAEAPYTPFPTVSPQVSAPEDYQRVQATPDMFGGTIARGAEQLGAGATKAGEFFGKVQTDAALNDAMSQSDKVLEQFKGLHGADALRAQDQTNTQLDSIFDNARKGLSTPAQQNEFDQTARFFRERYIAGQVSSHANQQQQIYTIGVNKDSADLAINRIASNADSDDVYQHSLADLTQARIRQAQAIYGERPDDAILTDARNSAMRDAAKARFEALLPVSHAAANDVLEKNKDALGAEYAPMAGRLKAYTQDIAASQAATKYTIGGEPAETTGTTQPVTLQQIDNAIFGQESGYGANPATSSKGAIGPGQIMPGTFAQYARPGERIDNPADNNAVRQRITADLWEKAGGDPARVAVGYFSGPGNIAPPGYPTPYLANKSDGTTTTSEYVSGVMTKLGRPILMMDKADAFTQIDKDYANDPEMGMKVKSAVNQRYQEQSLGAMARQQALNVETERRANDYTTRILKGNFYDQGPNGQSVSILNQIVDDPYLKAGTKANLANMAETHMKRDLGHDTQTYGAGFYDIYRRVHLPPGDPQRISDPNQLYSHVGDNGDLTVAGVDKLTQELQGRKTPDGEAESAMKKSAIDYAKRNLTFENPEINIKDPKGMDNFNLRFIPSFYQAYDQGRAAGKTPYQLLSADSPDFIVNKIMAPYKRSDADLMRDRIAAGADEAKGARQFDLATPEGVRAAYQARQLTREDAIGRLGKIGGFKVVAPPVVQAPLAGVGNQ